MKRFLWLLLLCVGFGMTARAQGEESCGPKSALCWPVLKRGSRGPRVVALQYLLLARGYPLAPDGRFAAATEGALRKFQAKNRLQVDGKVGWQSWEAITPPLKPGAKGNAVRALQILLIQAGFRLKRDSLFGNSTAKALTAFEKSKDFTKPGTNVDDSIWCYLTGGGEYEDA